MILPALSTGETIIKFTLLEDARRFRFACYSLRRRKGIGKGLSFLLDESPDEDNKYGVLVMKTRVFELIRTL